LQAGSRIFSSFRRAKHAEGFTLLELVLVLFLIGIASSLTFLSISTAHKKAMLRDSARKVFLVLRHARELAVMERTIVSFSINEGNAYRIESGSIAYRGDQSPEFDGGADIPDEPREEGEDLTVQKRIGQAVLPVGISLEGENLLFYPMGDSSGGTLRISDEEGRSYAIIVNSLTGKVSLQRTT
jgi:general secretion pathway protein H